METLGVAPKQKAKARQGFQRSAEQAKLFGQGRDRLVLPGGISLDSRPSREAKNRPMDIPSTGQQASDLNPAFGALLDSLAEPGAEWSRDARQQWLQFAQRLFDWLYKAE